MAENSVLLLMDAMCVIAYVHIAAALIWRGAWASGLDRETEAEHSVTDPPSAEPVVTRTQSV